MKKLGAQAGANEKKIEEMRERTRAVLEKASDYLARHNLSPEQIRYITNDLQERVKTSLDDGKTTVAPGGIPVALQNPTSLKDVQEERLPKAPSLRRPKDLDQPPSDKKKKKEQDEIG
jgi:hypothetical protein